MERMIFNCDRFNLAKVTTIKEVEDFAKYLVSELKVNINPDTDFADYIELKSCKPTFNSKEIQRGNQLMAECFDVCKKNSMDIYDLMLDILNAN